MSRGRAVWLVMRREMNQRLLSKAFLIAQVTTVGLIFAIFGLVTFLDNDDPVRVGLVGDQPTNAEMTLEALAEQTETEVEVQTFDSRENAAIAIEEGDLDAAVIDGEVMLMDEVDEEVVQLLTPAWQQASLVDGLRDVGLSNSDVGTALSDAAPLSIEELNPDPDSGPRRAVAGASVVLMFIAVQVAGAYIMMGVFEEKSSKVVELVLSSIKARYLLAGKVLGIAVLGIVQVVLLAGSALAAASIFGSSALPALSASLLGTAVIWFLLGYLLYGAVFAAGASLAPRQEDAQSTLAPVTVILMLSYVASIIAAGEPDGLAAKVVSWIPFTAPFAMPGRIAAGDALWWEIVGSMAVTGVAAVVVLLLAERIYVRSIIHTDKVLSWREAWSLNT